MFWMLTFMQTIWHIRENNWVPYLALSFLFLFFSSLTVHIITTTKRAKQRRQKYKYVEEKKEKRMFFLSDIVIGLYLHKFTSHSTCAYFSFHFDLHFLLNSFFPIFYFIFRFHFIFFNSFGIAFSKQEKCCKHWIIDGNDRSSLVKSLTIRILNKIFDEPKKEYKWMKEWNNITKINRNNGWNRNVVYDSK